MALTASQEGGLIGSVDQYFMRKMSSIPCGIPLSLKEKNKLSCAAFWRKVLAKVLFLSCPSQEPLPDEGTIPFFSVP